MEKVGKGPSMEPWTKETALNQLDYLIEEIDDKLKRQRTGSPGHIRWVMKTLQLLEEVFGKNSKYYQGFSSFTWRGSGPVVVRTFGDIQDALDAKEKERDQRVYREQLGAAKGLLLAASDYLRRTDLSSVYEGKDTGPESSAILKVINLVEHKLRKVIREKPEREKEVQDVFENLLIGAEIPYSREKESIEYSSKTYIPDFTIKKIDLAIDVKLCSREGREKEIIAEINDDILAYQTKYGNLFFIVYDLGFIRDIECFTQAFEKNQNVIARVVKH